MKKTVKPCSAYAKGLGCPSLNVDILISEITDITKYQALCIISSTKWTSTPPCNDILQSQEALDIITSASENGLVIGAWCSAVRVLAAADIIDGKNVTGAQEYKNEYISAGARYLGSGIYPVIDGNIVTATNGQSWGLEACEAIATAIDRCHPSISEGYNKTNSCDIKERIIVNNDNWLKTIGTTSSDGGRSVFGTNDGGYIIVGYTYINGPYDVDILLVKTDSEGNVEWNKTIGESGREYGNSCIQTKDGGYIITGFTTSYSSSPFNKDVYIVKTDRNGNILWSNSYGGTDEDEGNSICEGIDDSYIICGYTKSFGEGDNDVYLIKIDDNGNIIWDKTFGGISSDRGNKIIKTKDGSFVVAGATGSFGVGLRDFLLIKITNDGEILWSETYGVKSNYEWALSVCETIDDGFLIGGFSDILFNELMDVYVVKTSSDGSQQWTKRFGEGTFYDYGICIIRTLDGNYSICGTSKSIDNGNDIYLLKIDNDGNKLFSSVIGENSQEWANSIIQTDNGSCIVTGYTSSDNSNDYDIFLLKYPFFESNPPARPSKPSGPTSGKPGEEYFFSTVSSDLDDDPIFYYFDWGDCNCSGWIGPYDSGDECRFSYNWPDKGSYEVKVKAKDIFGFESDWSDPLSISMPKNKSIGYFNSWILRLVQRLLNFEFLL